MGWVTVDLREWRHGLIAGHLLREQGGRELEEYRDGRGSPGWGGVLLDRLLLEEQTKTTVKRGSLYTLRGRLSR